MPGDDLVKVSEGFYRSKYVSLPNTVCPECGSTEFEMRNHSEMWHEGDAYCAKCGKFIRRFDAG